MQGGEGHRKRLRERFADAGLDGFADHEALELLLTYAIPRKDTKPLAKELLSRFGSVGAVLSAPLDELKIVPGIGESAATLISLLLPLLRRYLRERADRAQSQPGRADWAAYCRALLMGERREQVWVLALDAKGALLSKTQISSGDEGEAAFYPRLAVAALLRAGAQKAVLCHNHPDGAAGPSRADSELTRALEALLSVLGIELEDHIIVTDTAAFSMKRGRLQHETRRPDRRNDATWQDAEEGAPL